MRESVKFPRGTRVRELSSGFEGVVTGYALTENGSFQIGIQPPAKDGELPKTIYFDEFTLETITGDNALNLSVPNADLPCAVNIGDEVEDPITGNKGIVDEIAIFLNGCISAHVQPKDKGGLLKTPKDFWKDHRLLKMIKPVLREDTAPRGTGCAPSRHIPRR
jgi:hypothetical protein